MKLYFAQVVFCLACTGGLLAAVYLSAQDAPPETSPAPAVQDDLVASTDTDSEAAPLPMEETTAGISLAGWAALLTIFVLAIFVGFEVITKVPPTLHTPLMSGSNAISGITLAGAIAVAGTYTAGAPSLGSWLGMAAVALATINVVGGFLVTHRMLAMFKKKK